MAFRGSIANGANGFFSMARIYFGDATYANTRWFVGLTDTDFQTATTGVLDADDPVNNRAGFSYSTARGGNIRFATGDGANTNNVDTGVAFTAQHLYNFYVYTPNEGTTVYWRIDDVTAQTVTTGSTAANLPTGSVALYDGAGIATLASGTQHHIGYQHLYLESDR